MWFDPQRPDALSNIRHNAQERDGLSKYGWEAHDGKSYGRQELHDKPFHLTTSWVKRQCRGCGYGGDWALLLDAKPLPNPDASAEHDLLDPDVKLPRISVFFYVADEAGSPAEIQTDGLKGQSGLEGGSRVVQEGGVAGGWQLHMGSSSGLGKLRHLGVQTPHMHNVTELVQQSLVLTRSKGQSRGTPAYQLPNTAAAAPNVAIFQLTASLPFTLEVAFLGRPGPGQNPIREPVMACSDCASDDGTQPEPISDRAKALQGPALRQLMRSREEQFDQRFADTFGQLSEQDLPPGIQAVAKAALSNLLGGIGYFYGASLIRLPHKTLPSQEAGLFSAVPSRSFFPRGFLWDEGFHQLVISRWAPDMSRDMLAHWLDLMNQQGWIAREQILGAEARSRVPEEFIVQRPDSANPPTLFLALAQMADQIAAAASDPSASSALHDQEQFLKAGKLPTYIPGDQTPATLREMLVNGLDAEHFLGWPPGSPGSTPPKRDPYREATGGAAGTPTPSPSSTPRRSPQVNGKGVIGQPRKIPNVVLLSDTQESEH
ncbi:hypothetical protein ABBQ32_013034 [Trebouxia sp. C0010 RCD-2024]